MICFSCFQSRKSKSNAIPFDGPECRPKWARSISIAFINIIIELQSDKIMLSQWKKKPEISFVIFIFVFILNFLFTMNT